MNATPPRRSTLRPIAITLFLGTLAGATWTFLDVGPLKSHPLVRKVLGSLEPVASEPEPATPAPALPESNPVVTAPPSQPEAPAVDPAITPFTPEDFALLTKNVDDLLALGRFAEAETRITEVGASHVPSPLQESYRSIQSQIRRLLSLLRETTPGTALDVPKMWTVKLREGGSLQVRNLVETGSTCSYETLVGIGSTLDRSQIMEIKLLDRLQAKTEVRIEFESHCARRGLKYERSRENPSAGYIVTDAGSSRAPGTVFFDLADFCAVNGLSEHLRPLLEEGLRRDANLLRTVHERKAVRLVDTLLYYLATKSVPHARTTLDTLVSRYRDTTAYDTHLDKDRDTVALIESVLGPSSVPPSASTSGSIAVADPPAATAPPPTTPSPPPRTPPASSPPVPSASPEPVRIPPGAPAAARTHCSSGDAFFSAAWIHLQKSDPSISASTWSRENEQALAGFEKARDAYNAAQESFEAAGQEIPRSLLNRFRETMSLVALCRKRSVSSR